MTGHNCNRGLCPTCDRPSDDRLGFITAAIILAERHGLLSATQVHVGMGKQWRASTRNLTMSDALADAVNAARNGGPS